MRRVKFALPLALCAALATTACNTVENQRSLYSPKTANGPYTRALEDGSWEEQKTVDEQYQQARRENKMRKAPAPPAPSEDS